MGNDLTSVQDKSQDEFSYVRVIRDAMKGAGWNAAELSRRSGVSETDISRALKAGMDIRGSKVYDLLKALNLISADPSPHINDCPIAVCDQKMIDICRDVKELVESGKHWGTSLKANIESFKAGFDNDIEVKKIPGLEQKIEVLAKLVSKGRSSGTRKKPARATGSKGKAGSSM